MKTNQNYFTCNRFMSVVLSGLRQHRWCSNRVTVCAIIINYVMI